MILIYLQDINECEICQDIAKFALEYVESNKTEVHVLYIAFKRPVFCACVSIWYNDMPIFA